MNEISNKGQINKTSYNGEIKRAIARFKAGILGLVFGLIFGPLTLMFIKILYMTGVFDFFKINE